jgi:UDP-glucose 4-epimerase
MNILITGGAGYIGSHITEQLIDKKYDVVILDNLKTGHKKLINQKANFIKGNINNKKLINNIIKQHNIQTIIHLAAYLNVSEAEKNKLKYYNNNVKGTEALLSAVKIQMLKILSFHLLALFMEMLKEVLMKE